jgi:hypothetical protein
MVEKNRRQPNKNDVRKQQQNTTKGNEAANITDYNSLRFKE